MSAIYAVAGALLILASGLDALWTTLWVDGHAGPLTTRQTTLVRRVHWWLVRRRGHRMLSTTGPVVLTSSVLMWTVLMWLGWTLLFSADPLSLRDAHDDSPATFTERAYFIGYTVFTMGNGDFQPQGPWWQLAAAAASLSGLFLVTLAVTYLVSLLQSVVQKRSFASQVSSLGRTPEELVLHCWDGRGFPGLELQLISLTEQLNTVSERHEAYPILHYYHAARDFQSVPRGLAIFDDALTLLSEGVRTEHRPAPAALHSARESVRLFLETSRGSFVSPSEHTAPALTLERLRAAGIPTVSHGEFADRLRELDERRRLLLGFLEGENREWPGTDDR